MTLPSSEDAVVERQQAVRPARSGSDNTRQCRPREETALKALLFLRPGTSPAARGLGTPQTSICLAPGGRPARRLSVQIWSGLSWRDSGGTRQVPWAQGGNLKNLLLSPGAGPKCAPGNPRAVLSGFLPGKKKKRKQNEPRRHVRLLCLEKGPGFPGQAGRRAIGVPIRSDRGEHGSENTAASPCHSTGLSSQRNYSRRPYVRQHHAGEDERRALPRGPHPGAPPGPGPRGSRHISAPGRPLGPCAQVASLSAGSFRCKALPGTFP